VAFADKILLNKVDLVSEAEKRHVISRIKVSWRQRDSGVARWRGGDSRGVAPTDAWGSF
jgi:G3E family GTPase